MRAAPDESSNTRVDLERSINVRSPGVSAAELRATAPDRHSHDASGDSMLLPNSQGRLALKRGAHLPKPLLIAMLEQAALTEPDLPIVITAGLRTERENVLVGGKPSSKHLTPTAVDLRNGDPTRAKRLVAAWTNLGQRLGLRVWTEIDPVVPHVHLDVRNEALQLDEGGAGAESGPLDWLVGWEAPLLGSVAADFGIDWVSANLDPRRAQPMLTGDPTANFRALQRRGGYLAIT